MKEPDLTPDLVNAAIAGRLPHGMGVARLADMPAEWSRQHQMLGTGSCGRSSDQPPRLRNADMKC